MCWWLPRGSEESVLLILAVHVACTVISLRDLCGHRCLSCSFVCEPEEQDLISSVSWGLGSAQASPQDSQMQGAGQTRSSIWVPTLTCRPHRRPHPGWTPPYPQVGRTLAFLLSTLPLRHQ